MKVQDVYTLSPMQEGMMFHSLLDEEDPYFEQVSYRLEGQVDLEAVKESYQNLTDRYEVLRTVFLHEGFDRPVQVVHQERAGEIRIEDLSDEVTKDNLNSILSTYRAAEKSKGFDLSKDPMMRLTVLKIAVDKYEFIWSNHHIIMDGWCRGILLTEFMAKYQSLVNGIQYQPRVSQPYSKYISWIEAGNKEVTQVFWDQYLSSFEKATSIPKGSPSEDLGYDRNVLSIPKVLSKQLQEFAIAEHCTLSTVFHTLWSILLSKYNHTSDVLFGAVVSGRPAEIAGIESMVGLFINTVPVRIEIPLDASFMAMVNKVQESALDSEPHHYLGLSDITSKVSGGDQLFDHIIVFENYPIEEALDKGVSKEEFGYEVIDIHVEVQNNYDLTLTIVPGEEIEVRFDYNKGRGIDEDLIDRIKGHLIQVIHQVLDKAEAPVSKIELVSEEEKRKLVAYSQGQELPIDLIPDFWTKFAECLESSPKAIALEALGVQVTYDELYNRVERAAYAMYQEGVKVDHVIAVLSDRSIDYVVHVLAILRLGASYVPIDPMYPDNRLNYILQSSKASLLIHSPNYSNRVQAEVKTWTMCSDYGLTDGQLDQPDIDEDTLAYMIFTSGSTGKPKGVPISRKSLSSYLHWASDKYMKQGKGTMALFSSIAFDLTVTSLFLPLMNGKTLFIYPEDGNSILEVIGDQNADVVKLTPAHLALLSGSEVKLDHLNTLIVGGEAFKTKLAKDISQKLKDTALIFNEYGPTEATVGCMHYNVDLESFEDRIGVPIGQPAPGNDIFVLDQGRKILPLGAIGELFIGGNQLFNGYLGEKSAIPSLIPHPMASGQFLYASGDLARWNEAGILEFLGRKDQQLKVNGFRIEAGEIENELMQHDELDHAIVMVKSQTDELVAYYESKVELHGLEAFLQETLPYYMIPKKFIYVKDIPLTTHGKIDKLALDKIEIATEQAFAAPETELERLLTDIWKDVLNNEEIGVLDNFFTIGGDSIRSIQICARMKKVGYKLTIKDVVSAKNIRNLAELAKPIVKDSVQGIHISKEVFPFSAIQKHFEQRQLKNPAEYVQSIQLVFKEKLQEEIIRAVFEYLQQHHDALRLAFDLQQGKQRYVKLPDVPLEVLTKADSSESEEFIRRLVRRIDLSNGPVYRLGLIQSRQNSRLIIHVNHLIVDGVSWRILLQDLDLLLKQWNANKKLELPDKTESFGSWISKIDQYQQSDTFQLARAYWESFSAEQQGVIPRNFDLKSVDHSEDERLFFELGKEETTQLETQANQAFFTETLDILLAALLKAANQTYGLDTLMIDLEGHGREDALIEADVSRTIGWFTSIYPVLLQSEHRNSLSLLKEIKELMRKVPNKGFDFLLAKYLKRSLDHIPQSRIVFNYHGHFINEKDAQSFTIDTAGHISNLGREENREYDWNLTSIIRGGKLEVAVTFSRGQYDSESVLAFMNSYKIAIQQLISETSKVGVPQLTPSDLTFNSIGLGQLEVLQSNYQIEDVYPLTPMQEGMLFHGLMEQDRPLYFQQMTFELEGELDIAFVEKSFGLLINHYPVLRTVFVYEELDQSLQLVLKEREVSIGFVDVRNRLDQDSLEVVLNHFKEQDKEQGFDLQHDLLMRLTVLQTADQSYQFIWSSHHILMDGWCMGIIINAFEEIYHQLKSAIPFKWRKTPQYSQYVRWLGKLNKNQSATYWQEYLDGFETATGIPKRKVPLGSTAQKRKSLVLSKDNTALLQRVCELSQATLNTLCQVIWSLILSKYNNSEEVLFGAVVSGRPPEVEGIETMVGLFLNTLPVRVSIEKEDTVQSLLQKTQERSLACDQHQYYPLYEIQSHSTLKGQLIDHILVFENYPVSDQLFEGPAGFSREYRIEGVKQSVVGNYDLTLVFIPGERLEIHFDFNEQYYDPQTIEGLIGHFETIIDQIQVQEEIRISDLDILSEKERQLQLNFNPSSVTLPNDSCLDAFLGIVEQLPDDIAVVSPDRNYTYAELDQKSSQWARVVRNLTGDGSPVAIYLPPSGEVVIGMIAAWKASSPFLPLDPALGSERCSEILESSECKIVLSKSSLLKGLSHVTHGLDVFQEFQKAIPTDCDEPFSVGELAYIIYTSGSTGKPKGVSITHNNLFNYVNWYVDFMGFGAESKTMLTSSYSFDLGYSSIFPTLACGGQLTIVPRETYQTPDVLLGLIQSNGVTHLKMTPSLLSTLYKEEVLKERLKSVQIIVLGGESIQLTQVHEVMQQAPWIRFVDEYGPTETTVGSIVSEIKLNLLNNESWVPNIGRPIWNTQCLILGKNDELLPIGATGELVITGAGVAKEYYQDPLLTTQKFVKLGQFDGVYGFRTGDIAEWLWDGSMVFHGRNDEQVKIRGFRVEIKEIEIQLLSHADIQEVTVLPKYEDSHTSLIAYYTTTGVFERGALREFLLSRLPEYMIPAHFLAIKRFPLTANGKLDKEALPEVSIEGQIEWVKPRDQKEKLLAGIWSEILGNNQISIRDNFFNIGGDSIRAIQVASRMKKQGYRLTIKQINTYQTIEQISPHIELLKKTIEVDLDREGEFKLTPIQYHFFKENLLDEFHYNQSVMLHFEEVQDKAVVEQFLKTLVNHHEMLRAVFKKSGGEIRNVIQPAVSHFEVSEMHFDGEDSLLRMHEAAQVLQQSIDLKQGPLIKCGLYHLADGSRVLLIAHHLVMDAVSWRILFEDLETLYKQHKNQEPLKLGIKSSSFKSWSKALQGYHQSEEFNSKKEFWDLQATEKHQLLLEDVNDKNLYGDMDLVAGSISTEKTLQLLTEAVASAGNIETILMSSLLLAVNDRFKLKRLSIDMEGHGRTSTAGELEFDMSRTIGWFTTIFPVILSMPEDDSLHSLLKLTKQMIGRIPDKGFDYLLAKQRDEQVLRGSETDQSSQIIFNYLGQFDSDLNNRSYKIAKESAGKNIADRNERKHLWAISVMIYQGQLQIELNYSRNLFSRPKMEKVISCFEKYLLEITDFLQEVKSPFLVPSDLSYPMLQMRELDELNSLHPVQDVYPLSPMQEGLFYHAIVDQAFDPYKEQMAYTLQGHLKVEILAEAWKEVIDRYDILRSIFISDLGGRPMQVVLQHVTGNFTYEDLTDKGLKGTDDTQIADLRERHQKQKIDIGQTPPFHLTIYKVGPDHFEFIWDSHHIMMDGWCRAILIRELQTIYQAKLNQSDADLKRVRPYRDFISWLEKQDQKRAYRFWENYLEGYDAPAILSRQSIKKEVPVEIKRYPLRFSEEQSRKIVSVSRKIGVSVSTTIQFLWGVLLARYNNKQDVVFGLVVSGRPSELPEVEDMIGLFINTLPIRFTFKYEDSIEAAILGIQQEFTDLTAHQYISLADIQAQNVLGTDLFNHILVMDNYPVEGMVEQAVDASRELTVSDVNRIDHTNYGLTLEIKIGKEIAIDFDYDVNQYSGQFLETLGARLKFLAHQLGDDESSCIGDLVIQQPHDEYQIFKEFNQPDIQYPDQSFDEVFKAQVARVPDAIALVDRTQKLTYRDLNVMVDRLAGWLEQQQPGKEEPVIVVLDRSVFMAISILGIFRAGCVYVPASKEYPKERIKQMIEDVNGRLMILDESILVDERLNDLIIGKPEIRFLYFGGSTESKVIGASCFDDWDQVISKPLANKMDQLAYILYTSGSTGKPKGVMIEQLGMLNHLHIKIDTLGLNERSNVAQTASETFDISIWQFLCAMMVGGTTVIFDNDQILDPTRFSGALEAYDISDVELVPSYLSIFLETLSDQPNITFNHLSSMMVTGEVLSKSLVDRWFQQYPNVRMINAYGPTEASDDITHCEMAEAPEGDTIPIGKPLSNLNVLVVDDQFRICPVGIPGEIVVSGVGVGRGYLNRKEETTQAFINDPFNEGSGRMYRTGDHGYWQANGDLMYLGRKDDQVKIKGRRMELGEIQNQMLHFQAISEAAVTTYVRESDIALVAYYVASEEVEEAQLTDWLAERIPHFMIPEFFIEMEKFPLTINGKIDKKALPEPLMRTCRNIIAPVNEVELNLVKIWSKILLVDHEKLSMSMSFYDLGGHSLKALKLVNEILRVFNVQMTVKDILTKHTLRQQADFIHIAGQSSEEETEVNDAVEFIL